MPISLKTAPHDITLVAPTFRHPDLTCTQQTRSLLRASISFSEPFLSWQARAAEENEMSEAATHPHADSRIHHAKDRSKRWKFVLTLAALLLIVSIFILYSVDAMRSKQGDEGWSDEQLENNHLKPKIGMDLGHGPVAHESIEAEAKEGNRTKR
ncbi:hypothetical protein CERZMDRAFT_99038 [Cercospora zeae-maydis SCOH1-5]|uniref:Uncharacterized protein n=1 Tax=Cercospora zeae-maydis SCOH1-5 TaxID=717836 RepID=A0A6A6FC28_9PEZI|nr:hypothetical protein CERZMDRAFT_99038 [Cercospora zeae-maydis SCOH1-5]